MRQSWQSQTPTDEQTMRNTRRTDISPLVRRSPSNTPQYSILFLSLLTMSAFIQQQSINSALSLRLPSLLRGVYSDTTQLNSTDPVEQRTAKSVVFLFMTSRPTDWVNCCSRCRVEFSWVELCRYKRAFSRTGYNHWLILFWARQMRVCPSVGLSATTTVIVLANLSKIKIDWLIDWCYLHQEQIEIFLYRPLHVGR